MGYQCSNYYRQLIKEGVIIDDNYFVDSNNQLTYRYRSRNQGKKSSKRKVAEVGVREMCNAQYNSGDDLLYTIEEEENPLPVGDDGRIECRDFWM